MGPGKVFRFVNVIKAHIVHVIGLKIIHSITNICKYDLEGGKHVYLILLWLKF